MSTIRNGDAFMKRENILKRYGEKGSVLIEYIIILSFIAGLAIFFSYRSWGLNPYIYTARAQILVALGFGDGNNYDIVNVEKFPGFTGTGTGGLTGTIHNLDSSKEWSWRDLYTNDDLNKASGAACGSFFLDENNKDKFTDKKYFTNSKNVSEYASQLLAGIGTGAVDTVSWAFTEGYGNNSQSLNLYWSNYNWSDFAGQTVPILQMSQENPHNVNSPVNYYVAYANVDTNGNLQLKNQAAALGGEVTYISPSNDKVSLNGDKKIGNDGTDRFETSSNKLSSDLAYSNFNAAQAAYMNAVKEFNQNNPGNQIIMIKK